MKLTGEVTALDSGTDGVKVTIANVRRRGASLWGACSCNVSVIIPVSQSCHYHIGRRVVIRVTPKP